MTRWEYCVLETELGRELDCFQAAGAECWEYTGSVVGGGYLMKRAIEEVSVMSGWTPALDVPPCTVTTTAKP